MEIPVTVANSHVSTITSSIVKRQAYKLYIHLPIKYAESNKKYPVIYLMDAQWNFSLLVPIYSKLYYDGFIPELIVVGICWSETDIVHTRTRDFLPKKNEFPSSGGAKDFISFMKKELFPFIEANYRAERNNRTIMGTSDSGLFVLYTLFSEPDLFSNYVSASPTFGWDNEIIYQYEKKYFDNQSSLPARLYMVIGGVELNVLEYEKLVRRISTRNYKCLKFESKVLENLGHASSTCEGFLRGLQFAFERNTIILEQSLLERYSGIYQLSDDTKLAVKVEDSRLYLYANSTDKFQLTAENNTEFYSSALFLKIRFIGSEFEVKGFYLESFSDSQWAEQLKTFKH